ncbi:hypothetical protein MNBD_GAMMA22-1104 [hydrothermal vent metagenome]|uniref:Uncharacterized protein n=1 Tax=hydrothermal vent metagenome TaxID=652676 RepID=A0A3B1A2Q9_9ZZZZ
MDKSKLASISIISILGVVILVMSLNRQQPVTAGVESSAPVVSVAPRTNDISQDNDRLSQVENIIEKLAEQQETMLHSLQKLNSDIQQQAGNDKPVIAKDNTTIPSKPLSLAEKEQKVLDEEIKNNQIFADTENAFYSEPVDDGWRTNEESKLNTIFESNSMNVENLECRGGSCRVELAANTSKESIDGDVEKIIRALPNSRGKFKLEKQADGSTKTIMVFKP